MLHVLLPLATEATEAVPAHHAAWVLHILGVITWVGGLLGMTVFALRASSGSAVEGRRQALESVRSLHHWAVAPGFLLLLIGGLWSLLAFEPQKLQQGWFHAKLGLVVVLIGVHFTVATKLYDLIRRPEAGRPGWLVVPPVMVVLAVAAILVLIRLKPF